MTSSVQTHSTAALARASRAPKTVSAPDRLTRAERLGYGALGLALFFALWSILSLSGAVPRQFLPPPAEVLLRFVQLLTAPFAGATLPQHVASSFMRFSYGFLLAAMIGVPLGLLMGWFRWLDDVVSPVFDMLRFIAPIAWVPFAALWFGTGIGGPIMIIFAGAFPPCLINAYRGARFVDPNLIEAAQMLGMGNAANHRRGPAAGLHSLDRGGSAGLGRARLAISCRRRAHRRLGRSWLHDGPGASERLDRHGHEWDDRHRHRRHAHRRRAEALRNRRAAAARAGVGKERTMAAIEFASVEKVFQRAGKDFVTLQDVELSIRDREFVVIVGPSGCGKTTCLRMAAGFEFPNRGTVAIDGRAVKAPGPDRAVVFQQFALFPWKTVRREHRASAFATRAFGATSVRGGSRRRSR